MQTNPHFFQRTALYFSDKDLDFSIYDYDRMLSFIEENETGKKDEIIGLYEYEYLLFDHFSKLNINKEVVFEKRKEKVLKINQITRNGKQDLLQESFCFNKVNILVQLDFSCQKISLQNKPGKQIYKSPIFYVKQSLLNYKAFEEIYIGKNTFDIILLDLKEHGASFSGNDLLEVLQAKFENTSTHELKNMVSEKLLLYVIVYDTLDLMY